MNECTFFGGLRRCVVLNIGPFGGVFRMMCANDLLNFAILSPTNFFNWPWMIVISYQHIRPRRKPTIGHLPACFHCRSVNFLSTKDFLFCINCHFVLCLYSTWTSLSEERVGFDECDVLKKQTLANYKEAHDTSRTYLFFTFLFCCS